MLFRSGAHSSQALRSGHYAGRWLSVPIDREVVCFGLCVAKHGPRQKAAAAKPMLRIVNMQKRLRPVYPGRDAIDFAIDVRDLLLLDPRRGRWFKQARNISGYNYKLHTAVAGRFFNACRQNWRRSLQTPRSGLRCKVSCYCRTVL